MQIVFAAIKTVEEALDRHVNDSLTMIPIIQDHLSGNVQSVIDVGSGAGLPGVILAITKDLWRVGCWLGLVT